MGGRIPVAPVSAPLESGTFSSIDFVAAHPQARRWNVALGDGISIDDYMRGGGAPSQLARELGVDLVDLTRDGNTTHGVLADLARAPAAAEVVTLTAGENDLLGGDLLRAILRRLRQIAKRIEPLRARVVVNTIYDPSDGDNELGRCELDLSRLAAPRDRKRQQLARPPGEVMAAADALRELVGEVVPCRRECPLDVRLS